MNSKISWSRPILSYSKVQTLVGRVIRNRKFQFQWKHSRLNSLKYLDVGCGPNTHENFINLDFLWHPNIDVCWDITRGLPFADASIRGIFTEHCLEHFPLPVVWAIMCELRRILSPGGVIRVVVPDGGLYLRIYGQQTEGGGGEKFPYQDGESFNGIQSPILSVNRIFYQDRESLFGHRFIYDAHFLGQLLGRCGFDWVKERKFREGLNPDLLIDAETRKCESLYMEAGLHA